MKKFTLLPRSSVTSTVGSGRSSGRGTFDVADKSPLDMSSVRAQAIKKISFLQQKENICHYLCWQKENGK
jgi:hypothetical protein